MNKSLALCFCDSCFLKRGGDPVTRKATLKEAEAKAALLAGQAYVYCAGCHSLFTLDGGYMLLCVEIPETLQPIVDVLRKCKATPRKYGRKRFKGSDTLR